MLVVSVLLFSSLCSALNTPRGGKKRHPAVARIRGEEAGKGAFAVYDGMAATKKDASTKQNQHRKVVAALKIQKAVRSKHASRSKASAKGRAGSSSTVTGDLALDRADTTLSVVE